MRQQKQLQPVRVEAVVLADTADATLRALACTLLVATTLVAATLGVL
ncbi:hypothetical protein [uncultured Thiohalocapsa sp.]|nr:hypothetical protein [uncultured Thiohalocapsa sp.]